MASDQNMLAASESGEEMLLEAGETPRLQVGRLTRARVVAGVSALAFIAVISAALIRPATHVAMTDSAIITAPIDPMLTAQQVSDFWDKYATVSKGKTFAEKGKIHDLIFLLPVLPATEPALPAGTSADIIVLNQFYNYAVLKACESKPNNPSCQPDTPLLHFYDDVVAKMKVEVTKSFDYTYMQAVFAGRTFAQMVALDKEVRWSWIPGKEHDARIMELHHFYNKKIKTTAEKKAIDKTVHKRLIMAFGKSTQKLTTGRSYRDVQVLDFAIRGKSKPADSELQALHQFYHKTMTDAERQEIDDSHNIMLTMLAAPAIR